MTHSPALPESYSVPFCLCLVFNFKLHSLPLHWLLSCSLVCLSQAFIWNGSQMPCLIPLCLHWRHSIFPVLLGMLNEYIYIYISSCIKHIFTLFRFICFMCVSPACTYMYHIYAVCCLGVSDSLELELTYGWLWATVWVLGTEPGSSARATGALNHWNIAPAHKYICLMSSSINNLLY